MELVSPRINTENHNSGVHGAPLSQSNWHFPDSREMSEVGARNDNVSLDPHRGGNILLIQAIKSVYAFFFSFSCLSIHFLLLFFVVES